MGGWGDTIYGVQEEFLLRELKLHLRLVFTFVSVLLEIACNFPFYIYIFGCYDVVISLLSLYVSLLTFFFIYFYILSFLLWLQ